MKERVCGKEHTLKITDAYTLESDILTVMPVGSCGVGEHLGAKKLFRDRRCVCKQLPVTSI